MLASNLVYDKTIHVLMRGFPSAASDTFVVSQRITGRWRKASIPEMKILLLLGVILAAGLVSAQEPPKHPKDVSRKNFFHV